MSLIDDSREMIAAGMAGAREEALIKEIDRLLEVVRKTSYRFVEIRKPWENQAPIAVFYDPWNYRERSFTLAALIRRQLELQTAGMDYTEETKALRAFEEIS